MELQVKYIDVPQERLAEVCRRYHVATLKVFGSVARDEAREESDIDLLVQFKEPVGLLELVRLERELSELFGREVDLVTEQGLSPYIRNDVLSSAYTLYDWEANP